MTALNRSGGTKLIIGLLNAPTQLEGAEAQFCFVSCSGLHLYYGSAVQVVKMNCWQAAAAVGLPTITLRQRCSGLARLNFDN